MRPHKDQRNASNAEIGSGIERSLLDGDGVFQNHITTTAIKVAKLRDGSAKLAINKGEQESAVLLNPDEAAHLARLLQG